MWVMFLYKNFMHKHKEKWNWQKHVGKHYKIQLDQNEKKTLDLLKLPTLC